MTIRRVGAGLALVVVGVLACVTSLAATGRPDVWGAGLAFVFLLLGFGGLAVARTPHSPWRPTRLALAIGSLLSLVLAAGIRWPPDSSTERTNAVALSLAIACSVFALLLPSRAPRAALALIGLLAAYGLFILVQFTRAMSATSPNSYSGPAVVISATLAAGLGAAWISALWHARTILRAQFFATSSRAA